MSQVTLPFLASVAEAVGPPATSWDGLGVIFLKLLAIAFLVSLNGFFVASEFAIVKVRASQLDALAAQDNAHTRLARHITTHLDAYLSATQLGITLASLGLGWLGEPFLAHIIEPFFALANITSPVLIETAEIYRYPQGRVDDPVDQPAAKPFLSRLQAGHLATQWAGQLAAQAHLPPRSRRGKRASPQRGGTATDS
jgi:cyclin M-like protein